MTVRDPSVDAIIRNPTAADVPWSSLLGAAPIPGGGNGNSSNQKAIDQLTLRDYFAAAALQGMLANNPLHVNATVAYLKADEMLRVRQQ